MKKRRILALLVSTAMVCSFLSAPIYAEGASVEPELAQQEVVATEHEQPTSVANGSTKETVQEPTEVASEANQEQTKVANEAEQEPTEVADGSDEADQEPTEVVDGTDPSVAEAEQGSDQNAEAVPEETTDDPSIVGDDAVSNANAGDTEPGAEEPGNASDDEDPANGQPEAQPGLETNDEATDEPAEEPTDEPSTEPTDEPTEEPTDEPTEEPEELPEGEDGIALAMALDVAPIASVAGPSLEVVPNPSNPATTRMGYICYCEAPSVNVSAPGSIKTLTVNGSAISDAVGKASYSIGASYFTEHNKQYEVKVADEQGKSADVVFYVQHGILRSYKETVAPTCTKAGHTITYYKCNSCGRQDPTKKPFEKEDPDAQALGHDFDGEVKQLNMTACGGGSELVTVKHCKRCDLYVTEKGDSVDDLTHKWETKTEPATCDAEGAEYEECANCHLQRNKKAIPKLNHIWGKWHTTKKATCEEYGQEQGECLLCGTPSAPRSTGLGKHKWGSFSPNSDNETHSQQCMFCGAQDTSCRWSHSFDSTSVGDCTKVPTCTICGYTQGEAKSEHNWEYTGTDVGHTAKCANPGCTKTLSYANHVFPENENDCTQERVCTICGHHQAGRPAHKAKSGWKVDGDVHYQECAYCSTRLNEAAHTTTPGDCTSVHTCSVCKAVVSAAQSEHKLQYTSEDNLFHTVTCTNPGCTFVQRSRHEEESTAVTSGLSCTTDGTRTTTIYCTLCDHTRKVTIPERAQGHKWGEWTPQSAASCTANGTEIRKCEVCGTIETRDNGEEAHHSWKTDYETDQEATCTKPGSKSIHCEKCKATRDPQEIPMTDHNFFFEREILKADCVHDAYVLEVCTVCKMQRQTYDPNRKATGHTPGEYVYNEDATCTQDGTKTAHCTVCGAMLDTVTAEGTALGHEAVPDNDCTTDDLCARCGEVAVHGAKEHAYSADAPWMTTETHHYKQCATEGCTQAAVYEEHQAAPSDDDCTTPIDCLVCGRTLAAGEAAHRYEGGWTHLDDTYHERDCENAYCSQKEQEPHELIINETIVVAPSSTSEGLKQIVTTCKKCTYRHTEQVTIPVGEHEFEKVEGKFCGGEWQEVCKLCGYTITHDIKKDAHDWADYATLDQAPTCTENGSSSIHCTRCDAKKDAVSIAALGHDYEDPKVVSEATCTDDALMERTCSRCGANVPYLLENSALGHSFTNYESLGDATCKHDGTKKAICDRNCGAVDIQPDVGSKRPHSFLEEAYHSLAEATCTRNATEAAKCAFCDATDVREIPNTAKGHQAVKQVDVAATCTQSGHDGGTVCQVCGEVLTQAKTIPALGHTWSAWKSDGNGAHSSDCSRCGANRTEPCSYSEISVAGVLVRVCGICGSVVDPTSGEVTAAASFAVVENAAAAEIDEGATPAGELIVRELDVPFRDELAVYEAFTVAYELDGEAQALLGKIQISIPLELTEEAFRLVRVDVQEDEETGERTEVWVELEYEYDDGILTFVTDKDGLFLLVPPEA